MVAKDDVSIERFAEVVAYERYYPADQHGAVRARLLIDEGGLSAARGRWPRAVAEALARGDASVLMRFARAYSKVEQRIRARRPTVPSIQPMTHPVPASPPARPVAAALEKLEGPAAPAPAAALVAGPPRVEKASYMMPVGPELSEARPAPPENEVQVPAHILAARGRSAASTVAVDAASFGPALPFDPTQRRSPEAAVPVPPREASGTEELDNRALKRGHAPAPTFTELPFKRFVEYRVECQRCGSAVDAAARLKLSEAERSFAESYWAPRVEADAEVRKAFEALRQQFLTAKGPARP